MVDGRVVRGWLMFAAQVHELTVITIEANQPDRYVAALQETFFERAAFNAVSVHRA
jgi:aerobic-type carbon monoxide dehydrogenase small subunit (CoxS/CutS family)